MFKLTMYPATDGDCLLLTWGDDQKAWNAIIDLGRAATWTAVRPIFAALENIELFTISHVDSDHVAGAVPMVREKRPPFQPRRVWFNALQQLERATDRHKFEPFSPAEGEKLSKGISDFKWPRNAEFESRVVSTDSPEAHDWMDLGGGLKLLLLSPDDKSLAKLYPVWEAALEEAGIRTFDPDLDNDGEEAAFEVFGGVPDVEALAAVPFEPDDKPGNVSSIAFVVEFDEKRVMLTGDANSEVIERRLRPFAKAEGGRFKVDLLKLSHHGSKKNSSSKLFEMIDCQNFAFSTDGIRTHRHPHPETIARILTNDPTRQKTLYFNYQGPHAKIWKNALLEARWKYSPVFPEERYDGNLEIAVID
jgi:beta-lactamase superfamily II metal-dependent hydrolase